MKLVRFYEGVSGWRCVRYRWGWIIINANNETDFPLVNPHCVITLRKVIEWKMIGMNVCVILLYVYEQQLKKIL